MAANQYALAIADLLQQQGQIQAMSQFGRVNPMVQAVQQIPQGAAGLVQQHDANAVAAQEQQLRNLQLQNADRTNKQGMRDFADEDTIRKVFKSTPTLPDGEPDWSAISKGVTAAGLPTQAQAFSQLADEQTARAAEMARGKASAAAELFRGATEQSWSSTRAGLIKAGFPSEGLPETWDAAFVKDAALHANQVLESADSWLARQNKAPTKLEERDPTKDLYDPVTGEVKTKGTPATPKVTFTTPVTKMVGGKRVDVQRGSDGAWYGLDGAKLDAASVTPLPERVGRGGSGGGVTAAQRGAAERWKAEQLNALETALSKGDVLPADLSAKKLQIENAYRASIGLQTFTQLPPAWTNGKAPPKTPLPTPETNRSTWDPRPDGTAKGDGFLGVLQRPDGSVMSEYSIADSENPKLRGPNGEYLDYPSLVPTLTKAEVQTLLSMKDGDTMPPSIKQKAEAYALQRLAQGKPLFAQPGEQNTNLFPDLRRATLTGTAAAKPAAPTAAPAPVAPSSAPAPAQSAPLTLPAGTAVGDTFVQEGIRYRVKGLNGQQVATEPLEADPKVGDVIIHNGVRVKITSIDNGQVRAVEVP